MTHGELDKILDSDPYHEERRNPTEPEIRLFLREVDYHCPLCGKELQSRRQKKPTQKLFEIAHIYPNRPTVEQYIALHNLKRNGDNSESFENKIALCKDCHDTQDYHTTQTEYLHLLKLKERYLTETALDDATKTLGLEDEIEYIVNNLASLHKNENAPLSYDPVPIVNKFTNAEIVLKSKVSGYVYTFYTTIRDYFREKDGKNGFQLRVLSEQIRGCFIKMNAIAHDKAIIFDHIVKWIKYKTQSQSTEACEAVVSFFVQNCEVFDEIS